MTVSDARPAPPADDEINLLEIGFALWVGKLWIAGAVMASLAIGAFIVLTTEPIYQAQGLLQLEAKAGSLALPEGMQDLLGGVGGGAKSPGEAEIQIMKSRMVMGEVVQSLDLQISAHPRPLPLLGLLPKRLGLPDIGLPMIRPYQWGNEMIVVGELEVAADWLGEEMVLRLIGPDSFALTLPDGVQLDGKVRARLAVPDKGFSIVVDRLEGPVGRQFLVMRRSLPVAVRAVQRNFAVTETPAGSSILRVTYDDPSPRQAERIVDAISQAYLSQNIARSSAEAQNSLMFIEEQLPIAEAAVTEAQNALNAYRQQQQSVDVDYETRSLLERATALEAELNGLSLKEEELKERYTVNHPVYQALLQNRVSLQAQLDELRGATAGLPETQKQIFNLSRDLEVAQQVYVQLLNRQQELRVVQASTVGSVRIIDTALAGEVRIAPRTSRTLAIFALLGLVVGAGVVLVRRALRRGIEGAQEIETLGLPVFATINFSVDAANHGKRKGFLPIQALVQPDDLVVEALRSLRTSLHFGMLDATTKSIMLTSAAPGAGKSFISVNLGTVAAQAGQRVCIIDADLRRGYLRRYFGIEKGAVGLSEYLAGEQTLDAVMVQGPIEGLWVIPTGRFPPNPSELLMRAEFGAMLQALNASFDLIIVDTPPTLAVTDPVIMGRAVGARIVVARHQETMAGELEAVRRTFETAGSKLTGAILNGYKASEGSRYGGQYYYYNYRYTYRSDRGDQA